jgi:hypothetical protein
MTIDMVTMADRAQRARVTGGVAPELHGVYALARSAVDAMSLMPTDSSVACRLVLRPRYFTLSTASGEELDIWTTCNVWVDGTFTWLADCSTEDEGPTPVLVVALFAY